MISRGVVLALGLLLFPLLSQALGFVQVVGLFPEAAVVNVDGQRKLLRIGQTGPGGVVLVSVDRTGATLRVDGTERRYTLSREYNADGFAEPATRHVTISKGRAGHYWIAGSVNGQPVQFMVDTGATSVAMNEFQARRAGIDFMERGTPMAVSTASGMVQGWRVTLDQVKVGDIELLGVEGVVLEGHSPTEALLGMSFLSRVRWREEQGALLLESKL